MTPEKQRIAIAEACGWRWVRYEHVDSWCRPHGISGKRDGSDKWEIVPDYTNDLNAMHDAWCSLTNEQHKRFRYELQVISVRDGHVCGPARSVCNATAAQRAEAFLRTIGKWEDGQ